jgi:hypothetical protein
MKIALLFTGQLRTYNMTKDFIKKSIIDKYDTDVFLSIDTNNRIQLSHKYNKNDLTQDTINDVIKFYNPIDYFITDNNNYNLEVDQFINSIDINKIIQYESQIILNIIFKQYYIVHHAYKLLEKHINLTSTKYDLIIRIRFDQLLWNDDINYIINTLDKNNNSISDYDKSTINNNISYNQNNINLLNTITDYKINFDNPLDNTIYVINYGEYFTYKIVNDYFWLHSHDLIKTMGSFYESFIDLLNDCLETFFPDKGGLIEHLFYKYLTNNNINIKRTIVKGSVIREYI